MTFSVFYGKIEEKNNENKYGIQQSLNDGLSSISVFLIFLMILFRYSIAYLLLFVKKRKEEGIPAAY